MLHIFCYTWQCNVYVFFECIYTPAENASIIFLYTFIFFIINFLYIFYWNLYTILHFIYNLLSSSITPAIKCTLNKETNLAMPGVSSAVLFESCQRNNNQNFFHKHFTGKYFLYIQIVFFSLMVLCYIRVQHIWVKTNCAWLYKLRFVGKTTDQVLKSDVPKLWSVSSSPRTVRPSAAPVSSLNMSMIISLLTE